MTRDEFCSLPAAVALGLVYDLARPKLEPLPKPRLPLPPKFDGRFSRKDGFVWMSEMDLNSLEWWLTKKRVSAADGGQYAERDNKVADQLAKWVEWRKLFPNDRWNGTRGNDRVTADAPSREPALREWSRSNSKKSNTQPPPPAEDDDYRF